MYSEKHDIIIIVCFVPDMDFIIIMNRRHDYVKLESV